MPDGQWEKVDALRSSQEERPTNRGAPWNKRRAHRFIPKHKGISAEGLVRKAQSCCVVKQKSRRALAGRDFQLRIVDLGIGNRKLTIFLVVYPVLLKTSPWNSAGLIPVAGSRINLCGAGKWCIFFLE
jgi:hypothetical protein